MNIALPLLLTLSLGALSACGKRAPLVVPPDPDAPAAQIAPAAPAADDLLEGLEAPRPEAEQQDGDGADTKRDE